MTNKQRQLEARVKKLQAKGCTHVHIPKEAIIDGFLDRINKVCELEISEDELQYFKDACLGAGHGLGISLYNLTRDYDSFSFHGRWIYPDRPYDNSLYQDYKKVFNLCFNKYLKRIEE